MNPARDAFHRYIANNDAPSPLEAGHLRNALHAGATRYAQFQSAMKTLEVVMQQVKACLSPLRLFPPEILGEIFVYTLDEPGVWSTKGRRELVNLGLVCKAWRNATLATPELWAKVTVGDGETKGWEKIRAWLERARGCPRLLCLQHQSDQHDGDTFVETLDQSGLEIDHIRLEVNNANEFRDLCWSMTWKSSPTKPTLRNTLRSFEMFYTDSDLKHGDAWDWGGDYGEEDCSVLGDIPAVTSLALRFPCRQRVFRMYSPTYGQAASNDDSDDDSDDGIEIPEILDLVMHPSTRQSLTSLKLECNWVGGQVGRIIAACPNLESLTCDPTEFDSPNTDLITLPKLKTLRLIEGCGLDLLDILFVPSLLKLDIDMEYMFRFGYSTDLEKMQAFTERSNLGPALKTLRYTNVRSLKNFAQTFVCAFPSVTKLTLEGFRGSWDELWSALEESAESSGSFSQLQELEVLDTKLKFGHPSAFFEPICRFLLKRTSGTPCDVAISSERFWWCGQTEECARVAWTTVAFRLGRGALTPEGAGVRIRGVSGMGNRV